jgi:hypothetical protein
VAEIKREKTRNILNIRYLIVVAGLITGIIAAVLQLLARVGPPYGPVSYGICIVCHGRDLIDWVVNTIGGTNLGYATIAAGVPVLTIVGITIGGFTASVRNKEFKFRTTKNPIESFICGFVVMISALILGACPLRTVLRVAYGDVIAIIGFIAITFGVVISATMIKMNAKRAIRKEVT